MNDCVKKHLLHILDINWGAATVKKEKILSIFSNTHVPCTIAATINDL